MSIELSPSQERRLHSILDRGLDTLQESVINISRSTPGKLNTVLTLSNPSPNDSENNQTEKTRMINSELKSLQEKLANLEAKLKKNSESKESRARSPVVLLQKTTARNSPRGNPSISIRKGSNERMRKKESSVKEIRKIERSATPLPSRHRSFVKSNKAKELLKGKKKESLKKDVEKYEELKDSHVKLMNDYEKLLMAFKRSESIRKKQSDMIFKLKSELKTIN
jgi:hypothetical protein